ncbi:MAG: hypothetical protein F9K29_01810 [Hyphomicrobiaceae bacterium]|nr:MAG: hypothetical protein F9K29_01810 [Hyphomicrobiaceae bacterium]
MHGQITKYREDIGYGVIEADNGRKYRFSRSEIINSGDGLVGQDVDFVLIANRPSEIIMMTGSPWTIFGDVSRV